LQLGPELGLNKGSVAVYAMLFGQWDRGREIIREVIANNFKYPLFFHAALLLYHFRMKHYENALTESDRFNLPFLFWSPLLRTAVLGQLNKIKEANESMLQLKSLKPNFEMDAPYLISRIIKEKNLADLILEGLRKAGMKL
jgi:hypothetical protein